jgi:hypothetical protein
MAAQESRAGFNARMALQAHGSLADTLSPRSILAAGTSSSKSKDRISVTEMAG